MKAMSALGASVLTGTLLVAGCQGAIKEMAEGDDDGQPRDDDGPSSGGGGGKGPGDMLPPTTPGAPSISFASCRNATPRPSLPLRRLSALQYRNSVRDVIRLALRDEGLAATVAMEIESALAAFPDDERPVLDGDDHGSFRRLYQDMPRTAVEATFDVGVKLGEALTKPGRFERLVDCKGASPAACLDSFLNDFGARLLRRPLDDAQRGLFRGVYGKTDTVSAAGFARVVGLLVASPQFLYFVEHGTDEVPGRSRTYRLDAYELASRLSYQFWETLPDDELWAAASSGALLESEGYAKQVTRLTSSPRALASSDSFYGGWLRFEDTRPLDQLTSDKAYRTFAGADLPSPTLTKAVIDEALAFTRHHTFTTPGKLDQLLASDLAFPGTDELAKLYGLPKWDGKGAPPAFAPKTRPGLLTRGIFLADGRTRTRPIIRGSFVRKEILCDPLSPPPADATEIAQGAQEKIPENVSTRELTVAVSEKTGGSCLACHKQINPLGFVFEGYDNLARSRKEELVIEKETGKVLARVPVDTKAVPYVTDAATEVADPVGLVEVLLASGKPHACFARQYVRYTWGRPEDEDVDGCTIDALAKGLKEGASLQDAFRAIAFAPDFQQRTFPQD